MTAKSIIRLNVGGTTFWTYRDTLKTFPNTRLAELNQESDCYIRELDCYFFDRNPTIFQCILDYYRTGTLHLPGNLCFDLVDSELTFWNLNGNRLLSNCCRSNWHAFQERKSLLDTVYTKASVQNSTKQHEHRLLHITAGIRQIRYKLWLFLDFPDSSAYAQVRNSQSVDSFENLEKG